MSKRQCVPWNPASQGFAKECAVVTHHRLTESPDGKGLVVDPESKLAEELIVRPTSETIMYHTFSKWIKSWRDLPLLLNQWANIVRWEMRPRLFLRTTEFLWQEGHTAHTTEQLAEKETLQSLEMYKDFAEKTLALHTITGKKSKMETFPGALRTYTVEALMRDGKALQCGTSHNLGQNFSKVFDIKYADKDKETKYVWQTSWGVSTRLIGAVILAHGNDKGLILPPKIAPTQAIIVPIYSGNDSALNERAQKIKETLNKVRVKVDDRTEQTPGFKYHEWELKGVPLRIELGKKELEKNTVITVRRDTGTKEEIPLNKLPEYINKTLDEIQDGLLKSHKKFTEENTHEVGDYETFEKVVKDKKGFIKTYWNDDEKIEKDLKEKTKTTSRCVVKKGKGKDFYTGDDSTTQWLFAQAY